MFSYVDDLGGRLPRVCTSTGFWQCGCGLDFARDHQALPTVKSLEAG